MKALSYCWKSRRHKAAQYHCNPLLERRICELPRITVPRTPVNNGKERAETANWSLGPSVGVSLRSNGYDAAITHVNSLAPLPKSRTKSSSCPSRDSRSFRPHSARLLKLSRCAAWHKELTALVLPTVVLRSVCV